MKKIYLDYAATTPVLPEVVTEMNKFHTKIFGNTMSFHNFGVLALNAVEEARKKFAFFLNAKPSEIYFTSSASESNNLVLKGLASAEKQKNHLIISAIEHDCVLNAAKFLNKNGYDLTILPVNEKGFISEKDLENAITPKTFLVSIIHGNNEIGTIQNIKKIGEICRKKQVLLHTDASQSFGKLNIDVKKDNIDLLTASSHKIYGPKGASILYVKKGIKLIPQIHGGGHENNLRSSTVNTPAIMGFLKAAEIAYKDLEKETKRLESLRDYAISNILKNIPEAKLNGDPKKRLCNNINISFPYVEGETLLVELDMLGVCISTGSACSSNSLEPSHVLLAIGLEPQRAHGSLRISLGKFTTKKDIDHLLKVLPKVIQKYRMVSPFYKKND